MMFNWLYFKIGFGPRAEDGFKDSLGHCFLVSHSVFFSNICQFSAVNASKADPQVTRQKFLFA